MHEFSKREPINASRILWGFHIFGTTGKAQSAIFLNLVAEFPTDVNFNQ